MVLQNGVTSVPTPSLCKSSCLQAVQALRLPMAPSLQPCISESTMPNAVTSLHGVQTHTGTVTECCLVTNGLENKHHLTAHSAHLHDLIIGVDIAIIVYKYTYRNVWCCSACQKSVMAHNLYTKCVVTGAVRSPAHSQ